MLFLAEKKENICNLMGFDIGSQCMVWSGTQWYKAEILGISSEGTKVRSSEYIKCALIVLLLYKSMSSNFL